MPELETYFVVISCSSKSGIIEVEAAEDGSPLLLTATEVATQRIPFPFKAGEDASITLVNVLARHDGTKMAAAKEAVNELFGWSL